MNDSTDKALSVGPRLEVEMPDGTIISDVPEGVTKSEVMERYSRMREAAGPAEPAEPAPAPARSTLPGDPESITRVPLGEVRIPFADPGKSTMLTGRRAVEDAESSLTAGQGLPRIQLDIRPLVASLAETQTGAVTSRDVFRELTRQGRELIDPRYLEVVQEAKRRGVPESEAYANTLALAAGLEADTLDSYIAGATRGGVTAGTGLATGIAAAKKTASLTAPLIGKGPLPTVAGVAAPIVSFVGGLGAGGAFAEMVQEWAVGSAPRTPEARAAYVSGETLGANAAAATAAYAALPTAATTPFLQNAFGQMLVRSGQFAHGAPRAFVGAAATESLGASLAAYYAQSVFPENEWARFGLEIGGGFSGSLARQGFTKAREGAGLALQHLRPEQAQKRAAKRVMDAYVDNALSLENYYELDAAGKAAFRDQVLGALPEDARTRILSEAKNNVDKAIMRGLQYKLVSDLRQAGVPKTSLTSAQIVPELVPLERAMRSRSADFNIEVQNRADRNVEMLSDAANTLFSAGQKTGNENLLVAAAQTLYQRDVAMLTQHLSHTETTVSRALAAAQAVAPEPGTTLTERVNRIGDTVSSIAERALRDARTQERQLYSRLPQNMQMDGTDLFRTYDEIAGEIRGGENVIPAKYRRFLSPGQAVQNSKGEVELRNVGAYRSSEDGSVTFKEMRKILSFMRNDIRSALGGAKPDYNEAHILGKLAAAVEDTIYGQLDEISNVDMQAARSFSRALNDVFSRAFSSDVMSRTEAGGRRMAAEAIVGKLNPRVAVSAERRVSEMEDALYFLRRRGVSETLGDMPASALEQVPLNAEQQEALQVFRAAKASGTTPEISAARRAFENTLSDTSMPGIRQALGFADDTARVAADAPEAMEVVEGLLREATLQRGIRRTDGTINPGKLEQFIADNDELLQRLPEDIREMFNTAVSTQVAADMLQSGTPSVQRLRDREGFFQLLAERGDEVVPKYPASVGLSIQDAISTTVPGNDPQANIRAMVRIARQGSESVSSESALEGLKAAVVDYLHNASTTDSGNLRFHQMHNAFYDKIGEQPSLAQMLGPSGEGVFSSEEMRNLSRIIDQGRKIETALLDPRMVQEIMDDPTGQAAQLLMASGGSALGATVGRAVGDPNSLIARSGGSKAVQNVMRRTPLLVARKKLEELMLNPEIAATAIEGLPAAEATSLQFERHFIDVASEALFGRRGVASLGILLSGDDVEPGAPQPRPPLRDAETPVPPEYIPPHERDVLNPTMRRPVQPAAPPQTQAAPPPVPRPQSSLTFDEYLQMRQQQPQQAAGGPADPSAAAMLFPFDPGLAMAGQQPQGFAGGGIVSVRRRRG